MKKFFAGAVLVLALSGCSFIPYHPFGWGSPSAQVEKQQVHLDEAKGKASGALVEEVHKTDEAIDRALTGAPHALEVAKQHSRVSVTLVDQIHGSPTVIDEQKWAKLIADQTSLDDKARAIANVESLKRISEISTLSTNLDNAQTKLDAKEKELLAKDKQLQAEHDFWMKCVWGVGAAVALFFLGNILQLLAHFNPAFETAANAVNAVVNPVMHAAASKARKMAVSLLPPSS